MSLKSYAPISPLIASGHFACTARGEHAPVTNLCDYRSTLSFLDRNINLLYCTVQFVSASQRFCCAAACPGYTGSHQLLL